MSSPGQQQREIFLFGTPTNRLAGISINAITNTSININISISISINICISISISISIVLVLVLVLVSVLVLVLILDVRLIKSIEYESLYHTHPCGVETAIELVYFSRAIQI